MYFYIVFSILLLLIPERRLSVALLVWGGSVVLINLFSKLTAPIINLIAHPLTLEFIAGCYLALIYKGQYAWRHLAILLLGAVSVTVWFVFPINPEQINSWTRIGLFGGLAVLVLYCLVVAEEKNLKLNRYLVRLGDASYSLYLVHVLVLSALGRLFHSISASYPLGNSVMILLLLTSVIVAGIIGYRFIEQPLLIWSRKVYGAYRVPKLV